MKILIVNTFDIYGGAARSAYRLHQSLLEQGVDSQMLVQYKSSTDDTVIGESSKIKKYFNNFRPVLDDLPLQIYTNRDKTFFSVAYLPFSNIVKKINEINPDVVHLHWICLGMMRIEDIARIKAPIVWSLHDNWAFTGGCHIMWDCKKYQSQCGACPRLNSSRENDLSKKVFERKNKVFAEIDKITIIGLSKWLSNCAAHSSLFKGKKHITLPNPLDTDQFKKRKKNEAREFWKLLQDKKYILFGALSSTSDINKGFTELQEALCKLKSREEIELVVFGNTKRAAKNDFFFKTHYLGHINDDELLVNLYSAADMMIVPSLQENLSNAIMESLSCGTPVVGFDIGGNSDMVNHKENGYLAQPFDTQDMARGIEWILDHEDYESLCRNAREKIVTTFDSKIVAKKYIQLYEDILGKK